jgi:pimeloyl-ACP methyl ester carboxylesterase
MRSIWRLTLVSLAAAAIVSGCEGGSSNEPQPIAFTPAPAPAGTGFVAMYAPPVDNVPYPNDLYNPTGFKLAVPVKVTSPLSSALNTLDGFSTTAVISAPFNGPLDPASLISWNPLTMGPTAAAASIVVMKIAPGPPTPLVPGTDYSVRISAAAGSGGALLEIVPLKPLAPRTRYAFIVTKGVRSTAGVPAGADLVFGAVRDTYLAGGTSVPGQPALNPLFQVIPPLLEAARAIGIQPADVVVAWSMLTQSTNDVLDAVDATTAAREAVLAPAGTTAQLGLGVPSFANIYVGYLDIAYYGDPANPLTSFWVNSSLVPPNVQNPTPFARVAHRRIPLLVTLPNNQPRPPAGWPVVIFQHGITLNRTVMFSMADSFAQAGFAVVAIDLPLHGVTDTANPFYQASNERHFNMDNVGAVGVFAPDGQIDNGWQILNVANPLNARDHIRQAVADTIALKRTLPELDVNGDMNPDDLDANRIHYVGISLGSIISGVFLGLDSEIKTATLSSPAGPWTSILTDPQAIDFGAPIRRALAAQGLPQGTVGFDNFVRDLQTVIDPVDPVNYAAAATATHPIHVIEILGDTAVPNRPTDYIAQLWGLPSVSVTTSGAPAKGIVRFKAGAHSSLFNPQPNPTVTAEMQQETVFYAANPGGAGTVIRINNTSVVQ